MSQQTATGSNLGQMFGQLEEQLDLYLVKKAPSIPKEWKELIVKFAPWLTVVMGVLLLFIVLPALGLSIFLLPISFLGGMRAGAGFTINWFFSLATLVLYFLAIPGLFKQARQAWYWLYYATLLGALENLVSFNLGGLVIGTLLSLYILFQVKEYYK